jgi:DNA-3-methyladenine glycosylase II
MSEIITLNKEHLAVQYLCDKDKRMAKVIDMVGDITYQPHKDGYSFLIHEIIEQMLSIKAGAKIYGRLQELCGGEVTANAVAKLSDEEIKSIGTANSKVTYIRNVTTSFISGELDLDALSSMSDEEVFKKLTQLKGIGSWTAKMYLIFVLDRKDILLIEDVAFLQSYKWMYKTEDVSKTSVVKKCKKWKPYSSIAARYLYRALDTGLTKEEFHLFKECEH